MVEDSLITDELRNKIGVEFPPKVYEIEKGMIRRHAYALDDPNPLWQDEAYAEKSKYGGIVAPPALLFALGWDEFSKDMWSAGYGLQGGSAVHGSTEIEYYQPVRAGDTITLTNKLVDVSEKKSKRLGKMLVLTYERTTKNQRQEIVAKCRQTLLGYQAEAVKHD